MEFEARKLRVQIPCGDGKTLIACVLGTCRLPSKLTCLYWTYPTGCWHWWSRCGFLSPCGHYTDIACRVGTMPDIKSFACDPEDFEIDIDDLPILVEQLEGQLRLANEALATANKQRKTIK